LIQRALRMASLPTGTVTFLFTDIEGSTKIAQDHRDTWPTLKDRHHAILRSAIEAHNGYVFQIIGDAFCCAFHTVSDGIAAALETQRRLQAEAWGDLSIRVRMGLHTGEAIPEADVYRGYLALSSVQRVASAAHGGQVLLSQAAFDLAESDLPDDVSLRDMGQHRLKDLLRPQHLYQLVVADLPSDFPPPRSLDVRPHNLPTQLTSFVGREQEIRELSAMVGRTRLVTLTGVGGTGKTRLALQVAADVLDRFTDGAWLAELAPLADPALVPEAIAMALNVREQPGRAFVDILKDYLGGKNLLLLLDSCEHLLEASARAADALLHAAPQLRILVTSREALGVAGEAAFPVSSLSLPAATAASAKAVSQSDAVRLFMDRAEAAQQGFMLSDHNASTVAQICTRLDGIPLAIELAAARARGMTVEQIASRLDDRFRLLTGGSRTALPRQRTLRATIDWSYNLLSAAEQTVLRRLSVFVGGWTSEAAERIVAKDELQGENVLELLPALVEKSLLVLDLSNGRYHMLETIGEYALERLRAAGEEADIRTRHLDYWLALVRSLNLEAAQDEASLAVLAGDHQNLLSAIKWCDLAEGGTQNGLELMGTTSIYWYLIGQYEHSYQLSRHVLGLPGAQVRTLARQRALVTFGEMGTITGHLAGVIEALEESLGIARELSDARGAAEALSGLGNASDALGDGKAALQHFAEAFAVAQELGNVLLQGRVLNDWAEVVRASDNLEAAETLYERSLRFKRQANLPSPVAITLLNLASVAIARGSLPRARERLVEALALISESRLSAMAAQFAVEACSAFMAAAKDWPNAARLHGASEAERERMGETRNAADEQLIAPLMAQAREALGQSDYAQASAEGSRLGIAEALSQAQAWLSAKR
jgi:predicted ATPase/class 3 adenylate cyclase